MGRCEHVSDEAGQPGQPEGTFYDLVGGHDTFVRLVRGFYEGVAGDPVLRAMYPEEDLGPAEVRLRMFLEPVSYTHLTLPTSDLVSISVVAVSLKKKNKRDRLG